MGTIFEELVRRFNEANNEEAGEHWTPRDAVKLMAKLIFMPIADQITSGTYLLYDGACGTGGMLTVAQETLGALAAERGKQVSTHLYGQEINAKTYAIAKADLLLKGEGQEADNIIGGPQWSTLSNDAFPSREFEFMLSNPPYGKSWKSDQERMGGKDGMHDPRFIIAHAGDPLHRLFQVKIEGKHCVVEYAPDADLRDTETVPLNEPGGIETFIRREVLPHAPDAWIDEVKTAVGYEISFTRYFNKPVPLRPLEAIRADILELERETDV
jgi:type I restriction-modification system DNA methylase subunit